MHVTVMISTFDRVASFKQTIRTIEASKYKDVSLAVCVDGNMEACSRISSFLRKRCRLKHVLVCNNKRKDIVYSYNKLMKMIPDGAVLNASDDLEFYPDCISIAVEAMERFYPNNEGLVGLNQIQEGVPKGRPYAFCLIGREHINRFKGYNFFCPDYIHFNSDREMGIFGKSIWKFHFSDQAKINHIRFQDETTVLGNKIYKQDRDIWNQRQRNKWLWGKTFKRIRA